MKIKKVEKPNGITINDLRFGDAVVDKNNDMFFIVRDRKNEKAVINLSKMKIDRIIPKDKIFFLIKGTINWKYVGNKY